jgi:hypothetical protein
MDLKPGQQLASAVSEAAIVVVRAPAGPVELTAGGVALVPAGDPAGGGEVLAGHEGELQLGKRYVDEESGLEVLCTKPGTGALAVDGRLLTLKGAKPLPSSD